MLASLLVARGFGCTLACNGLEAVDAVRNNHAHIDVIFMDNLMPNMVSTSIPLIHSLLFYAKYICSFSHITSIYNYSLPILAFCNL